MEDDIDLPEEVVQDYLQGITYHIKQGMFDRKALDYLHKRAVKVYNSVMAESSENSKNYLDYDQGVKAYSKILDSGVTAQEALEYVALCYGKDQDWVEEVKGNNYLYAKDVFYAHKDHTVQKAMAKNGTLRPKALKSSKTPNHQLRELHSQRKLHSNITKLKQEQEELKEKLTDVTTTSILNATDINTISTELNIQLSSPKQQVMALKSTGLYTQKQISEQLGIPLPTIKRWWKSL